MEVNSLPFWVFFLIFLVPYWLFSKKKTVNCQNFILLLASYVFYAYAGLKMCFLLLGITIVFYFLGIQVEKYNNEAIKSASLYTRIGVVFGVGLLVYYKFLEFFIGEFYNLLNIFGNNSERIHLGILMPLGVSFFTFKLISYIVEVYRENIKATRNFIDFAIYISFFPTILSGPIDRPGEFLIQLRETRKPIYTNLSTGAKHIVWGMFLKMCVADRISDYTDPVLGCYEGHNGTSILIAMFLYAVKMYTDFSGYTEMAIGVSKILGFQIRQNFNRPFLSQNMAEYWRRWHMSLTTWLTDYCFMPLCVAFRDYGKYGLYLATILNLVIVGFWHGANWTYGLFGLYHGLLLVAVTMLDKRRKKMEKRYSLKDKWFYICPRILLTFLLSSIGLLLFQAPSVKVFFNYIGKIILQQDILNIYIGSRRELLYTCFFIFIVLLKDYIVEFLPRLNSYYKHPVVRWCIFYFLTISILLFGFSSEGKFIYVQF